MWAGGRMSRFGAALAYYTAFAVAPLLLIALAIGGFWFGKEAAQNELFGQLSGLMGREGVSAVQSLVTAAANRPRTGLMATGLAMGVLCVGAMGVFVELQDSLNAIWEVAATAEHGWWKFIRRRLLSFAMVLGVGFLLLVSLVLSSLLAAMGEISGRLIPLRHDFLQVVNFLISLAVITLLFALIFKMLPEVKIAWRDVWVGALVTAILFNVGKLLIGFYLGKSSAASVYGAAGSFMILLMWVYYSAQILFFGAVFTRLHAQTRELHFAKPGRNWHTGVAAK
jgi:membrane protein